MKYPKNRCTGWLIAAGVLTAGAIAVGADRNSPPSQTDQNRSPSSTARPADETQSPSAEARERASTNTSANQNRRPPAAPSNVRVRAERVPDGENVAQAQAKADAERALTPTGRPPAAIAKSLDSENFAPTLRSATASSRGKLIGDVESRIASAEKALDAVESSSAEMSDAGRRQFKAASEYAKRKAEALRKSIQAARSASEDDWESARAQLGADYHAYAAALAQIDNVTSSAAPAR